MVSQAGTDDPPASELPPEALRDRALKIGYAGDRTRLDTLIPLAEAAAPSVRLAALNALALVPGEATPALLNVLRSNLSHQDERLRERAAFTLGTFATAESVELLQTAARDPAASVRAAAAAALGKLGNGDPAMLQELLSDTAASVRRMAAWALGRREDARERLLGAAEDTDAMVRRFVLHAGVDVKPTSGRFRAVCRRWFGGRSSST